MSSNKITVLIADDEAPARNRLKSLLRDSSDFVIIAEAENGDQVLELIIKKSPDIAFLDINMPGSSVFTTIPSLKNPPLIIFQTAYSEYGAQAFDINAVDYLLKPVSRERFNMSLDKIRNYFTKHEVKLEHSPNKDVLSIKSGETIKIVKIADIYRISFEDGFSFIHIGNEKLYSDKTLSYYDEVLNEMGFYQISRTDIINLSYVNKLHPMFKGQYLVEMLNGDKLTISRRRFKGLKDILM